VAKIEAQAAIEARIAEAVRVEAENLPISAMYEAWMLDGVSRSDGNAELRRCFEKDVLPAIGAKAVRHTTEGDLRAMLRAVIKRGACRMTSRLHSDVIQMFKWAEKRKPWRALMAEGNPAELIEFNKLLPPGVNPDAEREGVLSGEELRDLRVKLDEMENVYAAAPAGTKYSVDRPLKKETQLALWICLGTLCRIGELLKARWEHVDLAAGVWMVPRENTKTRVEWKVYLSPFALRQFKALQALTATHPFAFPRVRRWVKCQHSTCA
jgi:integrase